MSSAISRVLSRVIIYLDLPSPTGSSDLPGNTTGRRIVSCLVLLRMGFTYALPVTSQAVSSYLAFSPLPAQSLKKRLRLGCCFLLHFPGSHLRRTLSGILPYVARTFLTRQASCDHLRYSYKLIQKLLLIPKEFLHL